MEIETIKKDAKKSIVDLLNRSLQIEYNLLFNYPRAIYKLVNEDKIDDEQLIKNIEITGIESLRHFDEVDKLIGKLGGKTIWKINVLGWSTDVKEFLLQLLDEEKWVISWYEEVKKAAEQNKVKAGGLLSKLTGSADELPEDIVNVSDIISVCKRHIIDEERHIRLVRDSIEKLRMLKNK